MIMQLANLQQFANNIMIYCFPPSHSTSDSGSDASKKHLEEFICPYTNEDIISLRSEIAELKMWDLQYFKHKKELLKELEDLINDVINIGISL